VTGDVEDLNCRYTCTVPDRSRGKADRALGDGAQEDLGSTRRRFAAGYAACFGGSLDFVAKQKKRDASQAKVTCAVTIGVREAGGFVDLGEDARRGKSIGQAELATFVRKAHEKICAYSHATRGNVEVVFDVVGS
jgi:osmotically inducible protein OsmC